MIPVAPPTPGMPALDELLAELNQRKVGALPPMMAPPTQPARFSEPSSGLDSLLDPYTGGFSPRRPDPLSMGLAGGLGSLMGAQGGYGGATGLTSPGGGPSVVPGGSSASVPYSGPPDPTVQDWEANVANGRIAMEDMRRVPMNSTGLVNRLEGAKPWDDVDMRMPNAEKDFLMPEAAQSYRAMMRDAAAEGVPLIFGQSYRSYPEQVAAAQSRGIYGQGGWAAVPGTSNHGLGLAMDLNLGASPGQRDWLVDNADEYGWYFPMGDEPWHLQYEGGWDGWESSFRPDWTPGAAPSPAPGGGSSRAPAAPTSSPRPYDQPEPSGRRRRQPTWQTGGGY